MSSKTAQRLQNLYSVLFYCSDLQKDGRMQVFKPGERICINQERGALLSQMNYENGESFKCEVREYEVPPDLEVKIKFIIEKMKQTNFRANEYQ